MGEREALIAAVLADPDDDLPRLVFADWLEENSEPETARFIRAQIALAALPEWDPQSAALRRTQAEWDCSATLEQSLPHLSPESGVQWPERDIFRRGFAHVLRVPQLLGLARRMPQLLAAEPIERLGLYSATLDQWREFVDSPWLTRIREIDFEGIGAPIEQVGALLSSHRSYRLHTLRFRSAVSPAVPELLRGLAESPIGDGLRTLELAQAFGSDASYFEDFLEAFQLGFSGLKAMRLRSMGFGGEQLFRFLTSRRWNELEELALSDAETGGVGLDALSYLDCWPNLQVLNLDGVNVTTNGYWRFATHLQWPKLTVLDIANRPMSAEAFKGLSQSDHLANLRVARFRRTGCDNRGVRYLVRSKFWKNLVELDLRGNPIDGTGAKRLMARKPPPNLELLRIDDRFPEFRGRLQDHFEGKVAFEEVRTA